MPNIVVNPLYKEQIENLKEMNFNYAYPGDLELKPGSDLHKRIVDEVINRARASANVMSGRFDSWNKIDKKMTAYIEIDEEEEEVLNADERKPVSIVFPYSYSVMETLLTYMVSAFFQDPIFMYEGNSPEDTLGAILLEKVVDIQCTRNKIPLALHTNFRDSLCYGFGAVTPQWKRVYGSKIEKRELTKSIFDVLLGRKSYEKVVQEDVVLFEGNALGNIDPYKYLPDPNVPVYKPQDGEFVGWIEETSYLTLLEQEVGDKSLFNVRYLKNLTHRKTSIYPSDNSSRNDRTGYTKSVDSVLNPLDVLWMYVRLIPKDWGLSDSTNPEKWLFGIGSDSVVIKAQPLGLAHNMFPVAVSAPDFDGYSAVPLSRLEVINGLQEILDWLFNSHMTNVRKVVNDTLIVDPYLLNLEDLKNRKDGGIVKLRRPAWGRGITGSYEQLKVTDITRTNIQDSSYIVNWMQRTAAVDDSMMGSLRSGGPERLTTAEYSGTRRSGISRLERMARVIGMQLMQDIGYMFAYHVQQLMTQSVYVSCVGRWRDTLMKEFGFDGSSKIKVDPFSLLVDYDVTVRDGSIPGGNFSDAWLKLFQSIIKTPELYQQFDIVRIFKHIVRNMGAKNVEQFVRTKANVKVMEDGMVEEQVRQGNLAPITMRGGL